MKSLPPTASILCDQDSIGLTSRSLPRCSLVKSTYAGSVASSHGTAISVPPRTVATAYVLGAAGFVLCAVFLVLTGVSLPSAITLMALVGWQTLGGALVWWHVRARASACEVLGMGLAIGTALASLSGLLGSTLGFGPVWALLPTAVIVAVSLLRRVRALGRTITKPASRAPMDSGQWVAIAVGLCTGGVILLYSLTAYPLGPRGPFLRYHPDMPFFEALGNSLARFGPFESPFMVEGIVRYHWLSYAWTGQLSVLSSAEPFVAVTRVLPLVTLFGCVMLVVAWSRRLSSVWWAPTLGALLLISGGFAGAVFGGILTMDSPSQSMAVLWLLGFALVVMRLFAARSGSLFVIILLIFVMMLAMTGGKVSAAAPALAATLLVAISGRFRSQIDSGRAVALAMAAVLGFASGFIIFLFGSLGGGGIGFGVLLDKVSSEQGLNPLPGARAAVIGTMILLLAVVARWAGVLWLLVDRHSRWKPDTIFSVGLGISSAVALIGLSGANALWFSSTVSGPLAATSAAGCASALSAGISRGTMQSRRILLLSVLSSIVLFVCVWFLWSTGDSGGNLFTYTWRWAGPVVAWVGAAVAGVALAITVRAKLGLRVVTAFAIVVLVLSTAPARLLGTGTGQVGVLTNGARNEWFSTDRSTTAEGIDTQSVSIWTSEMAETARWLREQAQPHDVLATNVTRGPIVPGITHLPTLASAVSYQFAYGPPDLGEQLLRQERESWSFIDAPSAITVAPLCAAGVKWLWVDPARTSTRSWLPLAKVVKSDESVIILRLEPSACFSP